MNALENVLAETSVLGTVLFEGPLFHDLVIQADHFYETRHRVIFQAMQTVVEKGQIIDMVTVTTALGDAITQVGGTTYLFRIGGIHCQYRAV